MLSARSTEPQGGCRADGSSWSCGTGNTGVAFGKEEKAAVEGRTRFGGLQRVGEGAKRRQHNRGGGFLAMQEQRQDLLLW